MDDAKRNRRANLRPFKPGQSGNPGGRSKAQIDVRTAAREYTQEAIDTLVLVMRNGKPSEAAMAANSLLGRGWGRPQSGVELSGADGTPLAAPGYVVILPDNGRGPPANNETDAAAAAE
jgi:hypothetical protein